jgi:hypothetical protein
MFIIHVFLRYDGRLGQLDPDNKGTLLLRKANTNLTVENTLIFIDAVPATSNLAFPQCLFMSVNLTFFFSVVFPGI